MFAVNRRPRAQWAQNGHKVLLAASLLPLLVLAGCIGVIGSDRPYTARTEVPVDVGQEQRAQPTPSSIVFPVPATSLTRRVRRLSSREYNNVVRDLLDDSTRPADDFLEDVFSNGYDNGAAGLVVQTDQVEDYQLAAETLADRAVTTRLSRLLDGCDPQSDGEDVCAQKFLSTFPARAYRRPLTDSESERLATVFAAGRTAGGFVDGVRLVVEVLLQSPQFLYREELGDQRACSPPGYVHLTSHEIASAISFLVTGSAPDAALTAAATLGELTNPEARRSHAARLLSTPAARESMRALLHQWLATNRLEEVTKFPVVSSVAFDWDLVHSMAGELDRYFDRVLWAGAGSLRELFTSPVASVDARLADVYGVTAPTGGEPETVTLDASVRAGIMTRAGFLTAHSGYDNSGPIERGVFVLGSLLCMGLPAPPPNIPFPPAPADPSARQTTRDRFEQHVANESCRTCHNVIDGVGFGFESFDTLGVYRTEENGAPIDASGSLRGTGDVDGPFNGVAELASRMVSSKRLTDCFSRQMYRYAMGDVEAAPDQTFVASLVEEFSADSRITDLLLDIVASPNFVWRLQTPAATEAQAEAEAPAGMTDG